MATKDLAKPNSHTVIDMHPPMVPATGAYPFSATMTQFYSNQFQASTPPSTHQGRASGGTRTGVCASRHMAAEQRRRARINERLDALRSLVPHSARANTAAFLTEVYNYISSLHKQLGELGRAPLDLNASIVETDQTQKLSENPHPSSINQTENKCQRISADAKSDEESEVESEESWHDMQEFKHITMDTSPVLAPSLFHPTSKNFNKNNTNRPAASSETTQSNSSEMLNSVHSAFTCVNSDLCLSMKPPSPASPASSNSGQSTDLCNNNNSHVTPYIFTSQSTPVYLPKSRLREIQPAPMQKNLIQSTAFSFMPIPTNDVAATAAAIAESAAAAQTWGMAAAVAQAQAQVAAHVHAQAQAQVQAMTQAHSQAQVIAHAHSQLHSLNTANQTYQPVYQPCPNPQSKKRRRGNASETCATRQRKSQTVVRPIALKPRP